MYVFYDRQDLQQSCGLSQATSGHVTDREWSTCGSDDEAADEDDDDYDDAEAPGTGHEFETDAVVAGETLSDNFTGNQVITFSTTEPTSSASCMTSQSSSVTSSGDVSRPRTTADGCEDDHVAAGACDLIRHAMPPSVRPPRHSTSWEAIDDAVSIVDAVESYASSHRPTVDGH